MKKFWTHIVNFCKWLFHKEDKSKNKVISKHQDGNNPVMLYVAMPDNGNGEELQRNLDIFVERNKDVQLMAVTDIGYYYHNFITKQANA